ncbi:MAG: 5-oxoprolinase subunit PxpA [Acidimicrobiia bacterium]|nr:5-oxoprolinase subunit PxpA [Acidimicrobiia bacterium]
MRIDLNADLGESFGNYVIGDDAALMAHITSANIAAGFHAGDPSVLRRTVREAAARGVSIGAHPSFPDLLGFGRREMRMSDWEVEDAVLYQIASVAGVAKAEGAQLRHVKPHGALYNQASQDPSVALAIVRAITAFDRSLGLFAQPLSELAKAGRSAGLRVVHEGFADRAYDANGRLVPRQVPGAVIDDDERAVGQALRLALHHEAVTLDARVIHVSVDSICLHGDTPGAAQRAARIRATLESSGVTVCPP